MIFAGLDFQGFQDGYEYAFTKQKCFHAGLLHVGFDKLICLKEFTDVSNGYLFDDKCVFGAEVFVCKERKTGQAECISRIKSPYMYKNVWKLENFSKSNAQFYHSKQFSAEGLNWYLQLSFFFSFDRKSTIGEIKEQHL
ncbi:hypothetical protein RchiOBHm_Chr4g0410831 [Rosa chinensis]|uniref:MATH domain-containing protein n=1 Tax=Rosa chinensis TaxID=74649 RepID=A0A2P6QVF4_ROSCH|nr:hypothetical protein RchiOBHm_Chr4g0410831 [Rosa chinensis]